MSELKYWLWLSSLVRMRPRTKLLLLRELGGARQIYFELEERFRSLGYLTERELEQLRDHSLDKALRIAEACEREDIDILTLRDAAYPRRLAGIYDPPVVLYVKGRLPAMDEQAAIAVVGTRRASPYGLKMAAKLGYEITRCGGLVVSGLTQGVDSAAARGALMTGGRCVGVLATPIDDLSWGGGLAVDVSMAGAVVSEYPPGAERHSSFFRARNRISSGLSVAAVVVEAPERSGALLFADEALSQGRELFVVPGNADSETSAGSNRLLVDCAAPAMNGWDVLSGFTGQFPGLRDPGRKQRSMPGQRLEESLRQEQLNAAEEGAPEQLAEKGVDKADSVDYIDLRKQLEGLEGERRAVAEAIDGPAVHIDEIVEKAGLPVQTVLRELTLLQLGGVVEKCGDKTFRLINTQK